MSSPLSEAQLIRRVHDRLAFGAKPGQLAAAVAQGLPAVVQSLMSPTGPDAGAATVPDPTFAATSRVKKGESEDVKKARNKVIAAQRQQLVSWWLQRAVAADNQLSEKLTWFWHGHFATSIAKVRSAQLMYNQHVTQQKLVTGSFTTMANAMIVDPAMLVWLDGQDNVKGAPNENLAREFMELFSLGHGNYSETDVREAARALTGWTVSRKTGTSAFVASRHDDTDKTILKHTANFDANSFVSLVLSQPASPKFVIGRLWFRLVSIDAAPDAATMDTLLGAYGSSRDIGAVITAITKTPAFASSDSSLVKSPVEWFVGLCRALGVSPASSTVTTATKHAGKKAAGRSGAQLVGKGLTSMGQTPFAPPSVGGWPAGSAWLTTATANSRIELAAAVAGAANAGLVEGNSPSARIESVRQLLGVDAWTSRTSDALSTVADNTTTLLTAAACAPEYCVSR